MSLNGSSSHGEGLKSGSSVLHLIVVSGFLGLDSSGVGFMGSISCIVSEVLDFGSSFLYVSHGGEERFVGAREFSVDLRDNEDGCKESDLRERVVLSKLMSHRTQRKDFYRTQIGDLGLKMLLKDLKGE